MTLFFQFSAANIVGQLAGTIELQVLATSDLSARSSDARLALVKAMEGRLHGAVDALAAAHVPVLNAFVSDSDPRVAEKAGFLRLRMPGMDAQQSVNLLRSFASSAARVGAIRGFTLRCTADCGLHVKHVQLLLGDTDGAVRKQVFTASLVRKLLQPAERVAVLTKGLEDTDADVRLSAVAAIKSDIHSADVARQLQALQTNDPELAVRNAATEALKQLR